MDFGAGHGTIELQGIGGGQVGVRTLADLTWRDTNGQDLTISMPIVLVQPNPPAPGLRGNWTIPSLLGRDILAHFDLELSYNPPAVTLTEAAPN